MLKRWPDYAKATPDYLVGMIEIFEEYPEPVQLKLAHPRFGLRGVCVFLPTNADVVKLGDQFQREELASRPKPAKPVLVEFQQSPEERARIGEKMRALAAELAKVKTIEPIAPREPYQRPTMTKAQIQADLACIKIRATPERESLIVAAIEADDQDALSRALKS